MLEPPSPELVELLLRTGACRSADLRACRRLVRRLCRDLPAFDSVWLDALVQSRRLTPFQARILSSRTPERIQVGPFLAVERLGPGSGRTMAARLPTARRPQVAVKRFAAETLSTDVQTRLHELAERLRGLEHPSVVGPHACERAGEEIALVSHLVDGPPLSELLIRRGRFPAKAVWEIGRQLLEGLSALHAAGVIHGDLRLSNVRLGPHGRAAMVDAGVQPAVEPELTVHSGTSSDSFETVAPERIGIGRRASVRTDLYALGCLLWQLLAGRPPFPGADPLTKISSHQTRDIDDVRRWAPETPAALAEGLRWLTRRDPDERPAGAGDLLARWKPSGSWGRRRLSAFLQAFRSPPPEKTNSRLNWAAVAAVLFAISGLAAFLADQGLRANVITAIRNQWGRQPAGDSPVVPDTVPVTHPVLRAAEPSPLPKPDEAGVIELPTAGPWKAGTVQSDGSVVIRGRPGIVPVIVVQNEPLRILARTVELQGLTLRMVARGSSASLVRVNSGSLLLTGCAFDERREGTSTAGGPAAIAWQRLENSTGKAVVRDCVFRTSGTTLRMQGACDVHLENCWKTGPGPLLDVGGIPAEGSVMTCRLERLTLRESGPLLRWRVGQPSGPMGQVRLEPVRSVLAIEPEVALIDLVTPSSAPEISRAVSVIGTDSLVRTDFEGAWVRPDGRREAVPNAQAIEMEGLRSWSDEVRFAGELTARAADSRIEGLDDPVPGIDPSRLPVTAE